MNPAQLVDMFDKVFKGHGEVVEKRRRDKCVYCTEIGVSGKKAGYKYTYYYCALCMCTLSAGSSFTVAKL